MSEKNEQEVHTTEPTNKPDSKDETPKPPGWLQKLTDPQATIIAALITSIVSLLASFFLAVFTHQQSRRMEEFKTTQSTTLEAFKTTQSKNLEEFKANLVGLEQRKDELNISRGSALKYIQAMKDTIDRIKSDRAMPFGSAKAFLGTAAYELQQAYGDSLKSIVSNDPNQELFRERVHSAKNLGVRLLSDFNQTKEQDSEAVPESLIAVLNNARSELDKIEAEIQKDLVKTN
jgi:hypothetical protein